MTAAAHGELIEPAYRTGRSETLRVERLAEPRAGRVCIFVAMTVWGYVFSVNQRKDPSVQTSANQPSSPDERLLAPDLMRVLRTLEPLPPPGDRPTMVVLCGLPGVGKSTFARRLAARAPVAVVGSDEVRKTLFPQPQYTGSEHARVFGAVHTVLAELLRRRISAVFDATNLYERLRRRAYRIAQNSVCGLVIVEVVAPPEVVRQRLERRAAVADPRDRSDATWEVYLQMADRMQPVRQEHFTVDTSVESDQALMAIAQLVV